MIYFIAVPKKRRSKSKVKYNKYNSYKNYNTQLINITTKKKFKNYIYINKIKIIL